MKERFIKKTIVSLWILLCISCISCIPVYAANDEEDNKSEKSIIDVIKEQQDDMAEDYVFQKQYYDEKLREYDLSDDAIIKVYYEPVWLYAGREMTEVLSDIDNSFMSGYVIFDDKPIRVGVSHENEGIRIELVKRYEESPTYLADIINSSIYNSKIATYKEEYDKVICFDGTGSYQGVVVYYLSENNSVVYYYESYSSEPLEFALDDFKIYGSAYYEYLASDENNYSENGMFLGGGVKNFATFVEQLGVQDFVENDNPIIKREEILLGVALLIVILVCVSMMVRLQKIKK